MLGIRCNKNDHMEHYFYDFNAYQTIYDISLIPNGITLCQSHHDLVEDWHRYGEVTDEKYHHKNLYHMINSSYEQAYRDSTNMKC